MKQNIDHILINVFQIVKTYWYLQIHANKSNLIILLRLDSDYIIIIQSVITYWSSTCFEKEGKIFNVIDEWKKILLFSSGGDRHRKSPEAGPHTAHSR